MRLMSAQHEAIWSGSEPLWNVRLGVEDGTGAFRDFCSILGEDWVKALDFGDSLDAPGQDLTMTMAYRRYFDNASPFVTGNRFSDILQAGRRIVVQARPYCEGQSPTIGPWMLLFDGVIQGLNLQGNDVAINAIDRITHELQRAWLEEEIPLGGTVDDPVLLAQVIVTVLDRLGVDQSIARFLSLDTPAFAIKRYNQLPASAQDIIKSLVDLIGWDCRPRWREAQQAFGLTLQDVERAAPTVDRIFYPEQWRDAPRAEVRLDEIRNAVAVWYTDGATSGNNFKKMRVEGEDVASIAKYGRRWMEITEGSTSPIDTNAEAIALASAVLSDLAEPDLNFDVALNFFPWVELNDYYEFRPDGLRFGTLQRLAVYAYRHSLGQGALRTALQVRGKPASGKANWLEKEARPGLGRPRPTENPGTPAAASAESSTEGAKLSWSWPKEGRAEVVEVHIGDNASFTPDASTLAETVRGASFLDRVTLPGEKRFYKLVTVDRDGNTSPPTPAISATANFLTRDKLSPALRTAVGASMSGDQSITSGNKVDFDTLKFGDAGLLDTGTNEIEPNYEGLAHVHVRVMPGASSEAVTWSLELRDGLTVLARTGIVDGNRALVISEVLELTGGEVLSVVVTYSGSGGVIEADGSVWSVVASQAGVPASTPSALHVNTVAPVLSGTPRVAQTVTVTDGSWSPSTSLTYSYQFRVGGENRGLTTSPSLVLLGGDEGKFVDCLVVASHPTKGDVFAASNRLGPIEAQVYAPQVTSTPTITVEEA